jgi:hypothetical protein
MKYFNDFMPVWSVIKIQIASANPFWKQSLIHGEKHTERCLYAASCLMSHLSPTMPTEILPHTILVPVAFHDAGRKGEGSDCWEQESCEMCEAYLIGTGTIPTEAKSQAAAILKTRPHTWQSVLLHDADALEYSRLIRISDFDYTKLLLPEFLAFTENEHAEFLTYCKGLLKELYKMQEEEIYTQIAKKQ